MRYPAVRALFAIVFVSVVAFAGYELWMLERELGRTRAQARAFEELSRQVGIGIAELRAAQQAYVAAGQGEDFWIGKVEKIQGILKEEIQQLGATATVPEALAATAEITKGLEAFTQMNRRAVEYTRAGQRLLASDLIFTDGLEMLASATSQLEQARTLERARTDKAEAESRTREAYNLAGTAAAGLLVLLCLVPIRRFREPAAPHEGPSEAADALGSLHLRSEGTPTEPENRVVAPEQVPTQASPPVLGPTLGDLQATASLCTEFSRVADARELTPLLERAAGLLGASGAIVWVAEREGRELRPILAYGYSPQALSRIGSISCDEDHATAAAFRKAALEVVPAGHGAAGAIVTPLLTPTGCIGVMAAEISDGRETDAARQALAALIAAQLSVLMAVEPIPEAAEPQLQVKA